MKIFRKQNPLIIKILKVNTDSVQSIRKFTFCDERRIENGLLLCHFITGEVLLLEKDDFLSGAVPQVLTMDELKPSCREYLFLHKFLVENDYEDSHDVDDVRRCIQLYKMIQFKGFDRFTILTTTDCNARCSYCYEKGISRISMDDTIAKDVASYIIKNLRQCGTNRANIEWFGGEPLFNDKAIDIISKMLLAAGIDYSSTMVTNGLLMDEEKIDKAVRLWKLKNIQITLDGTEEVYNKTKAYIGSVENAYHIVMQHIQRLLEADINVYIRLNVSEANVEDLNRLVDELGERFRNEKKPYVYLHVLYQYNSKAFMEKKERLMNACSILTEKLKDCGLHESSENYDPQAEDSEIYLRERSCMADNLKSVVILPDGRLHSCEHINANYTWGSIYSGETKIDNCHPSETEEGITTPIAYWSEADPAAECHRCKFYPFCIKPKRCPIKTIGCDPDKRNNISEKVNNKIALLLKEKLVTRSDSEII